MQLAMIFNDEKKPPRPVLVIVAEWPSGTMAMKFGYAMTMRAPDFPRRYTAHSDGARTNFQSHNGS
jgi:hypothetical protein